MSKKHIIVNSLILAIIPIIGSIIYCALQGHGIWQLFLPDSGWNDELMYYKMTEAVLDYGFPQGYFGFMEKHAEMLSFAAWSPVIILHWVLWGLLFGWNLMSPYFSNIATLTISLFLFGILVRPSRKQTFLIAGLLAVYKPLFRYTLSCVPEIEIISLIILYIGLCINIAHDQKSQYPVKRLLLLYLISALMTLIRPYLLLLLLTPAVLWGKKIYATKRKKTVAILLPLFVSGAFLGGCLFAYMTILKYLSAPYVAPLFSTAWLEGFFRLGFAGGLHQTIGIVRHALGEMKDLILQILTHTAYYAAGLYYLQIIITVLAVGVLFLLAWIPTVKHKADEKDPIFLLLLFQLLFAACAFLIADVLMYRIEPGGRHSLVYMVGLLMLLPFTPNIKRKTATPLVAGGVMIVFLATTFAVFGRVPYEYTLSYDDGSRRNAFRNLSSQLEAEITFSREAPSYENTVLWVYDVDSLNYAEYYALPSGCGINLVFNNYVQNNFDNIQSRYIGLSRKSCLIPLLDENGATLIGEGEETLFYRLNH